MRQSNLMNLKHGPQAPILPDALSQDVILSVGAVFSFDHKDHEGHEGHEAGSMNDERRSMSCLGLLTRPWSGSFHRPDCSISGAVLSTINFHHEGQGITNNGLTTKGTKGHEDEQS